MKIASFDPCSQQAASNASPYILFVAIDCSAVDVTVACLDSMLHCVRGIVAILLQVPCTKPQKWNGEWRSVWSKRDLRADSASGLDKANQCGCMKKIR